MGHAVQAEESFVCEVDGYDYNVTAGDIVDSDHPLVRSHPGMFGALAYRFVVEEATAKPGVKRKTKASAADK